MRIIIDGYNLFKQYHQNNTLTVEGFIILLKRYASIKHHMIELVFDGGMSNWPTTYQDGLVTVIHAGYGKTADEYLTTIFEEKSGKGWDLFISSDRELIRVAKQYSLVNMNSHMFWQFLKKIIKSPVKTKTTNNDVVIKKTTSDNPFLDMLMQEGAHMKIEQYKKGEAVNDADEKEIFLKGKTLSKEERALSRIIKKL